ncbi:phosphatase PAP2 family protein [Aureispira anguillae]|nr:phosphatidic acid phosphatase [Aureispira anguillae]
MPTNTNSEEYRLAIAKRFQAIIPLPFQLVAQVISMVFHPLFLLSYAYILLAYFNPFLFGEASTSRIFVVTSNTSKGIWFINLVLFSCIIPLVGVLLMRGLGMIRSLALDTQDERKIPYVLTGMFYMAMVAQNNYNTSLPLEIKIFTLGATIALFVAFFINLFTKISMHTVGMGGFLAMLIIIIARSYAGAENLFIFGILSCGLVGTSRLLLGAHQTSDIYGGYFVGFLSQFVALNYMFST